MKTEIIVILAVVITFLSTGMVLIYARRHLVDQINERSSHRTPTPRGGGLGLIIGLCVATLAVTWWQGIGIIQVSGLVAIIIGMSLLGWWDDHCHLSARLRLPVQLLLVSAICGLIGVPTLFMLTQDAALLVAMWWFLPCAVLGGGWLVNLTNFMDGIDGIAGTQGVIGCVGLALLLPDDALAVRVILFAGAGACLGFLVWNWPPAKIFMGDVGSTALGLVFALGILAGLRQGIALELLLLPLAPFIADATCTLVRRAWRRENLAQAHRSHLYQRLALAWGSHAKVTILYGALALCGAGFAVSIQQGWLPSSGVISHSGTIAWLMIWCGLVWYGMRYCPVNDHKNIRHDKSL